jgi:hypothetical protein
VLLDDTGEAYRAEERTDTACSIKMLQNTYCTITLHILTNTMYAALKNLHYINYLYYTYTTHTLHIHYTCTIHTLYIHYTYTIHTHYTYTIHTLCIHYTYTLYIYIPGPSPPH